MSLASSALVVYHQCHPGGPRVSLWLIKKNDLRGIPGIPSQLVSKGSACNAGDPSWVVKILWKRKWQPTPVFLPGESQGQRSLAGYSPWGSQELDMTERLNQYQHQT